MRRRETGFLVIGLIVGALIGAVMVSSGALRGGLEGTAGLRADAEPVWYLIDYEVSRNWLIERFPQEETPIDTAFTRIAALTTTTDFAQTVRDTQSDVDFLIARAYTALTGSVLETALVPTPAATPSPLVGSLADGAVSACLGIDENPYNTAGYALYFYVEIPSTQTGAIPADWGAALEEEKDDDLYWQRLACSSQPSGVSSREGR